MIVGVGRVNKVGSLAGFLYASNHGLVMLVVPPYKPEFLQPILMFFPLMKGLREKKKRNTTLFLRPSTIPAAPLSTPLVEPARVKEDSDEPPAVALTSEPVESM